MSINYLTFVLHFFILFWGILLLQVLNDIDEFLPDKLTLVFLLLYIVGAQQIHSHLLPTPVKLQNGLSCAFLQEILPELDGPSSLNRQGGHLLQG